MQDTGYIFINGAGFLPNIWDEVRKKLDAPSVAIEFPSRGAKTKGLTFDDYVSSAIKQIESLPASKVILVGHSIGGVVMMRLGELLGDRVAGYVAIGATIPQPGDSFLTCLPQPKRTIMGLVMRLAGTAVPESAIRKGLCNDLTDAQAQRIVDAFTPESLDLYTAPVEYQVKKIPAVYVVLTKDQEFSAPFQRAMAEQLNASVKEVEAGHLAMISKPEEILESIKSLR